MTAACNRIASYCLIRRQSVFESRPCIYKSAFLFALLLPVGAQADPVKVRHTQGTAHGFLKLETLEGKPLAVGDLIQTSHGGLITSRLVFRFRDGSLDDETTVFSQRGVLRMVSDRHIQKGPFFPHATEVNITADGHVTSSRTDSDGKVKTTDDHMDLPPDISNGMPLTVVLNLTPRDPETKISYLLMTSKPTLAHLTIRPDGTERFTVGGAPREANRFVTKIDLSGIKGIVAPMIGKQPKDFHLLFLGGEAPVFLKAEGQIYEDGPVIRIKQISATFSDGGQESSAK